MSSAYSARALPTEPLRWPISTPLEDARELIARYPNLSEGQLARLINLYPELTALDTALMLSDEQLAPRLDRFSADHRSRIRPPLSHYSALLIYAGLTIAVLVWAIFASPGAS